MNGERTWSIPRRKRLPVLVASPSLFVYTALWWLISPVPWVAKVAWVGLMAYFWRRKARFASRYYNGLMAVGDALLQAYLPGAFAGETWRPEEPGWSAAARRYWQEQYAYAGHRGLWKALWPVIFFGGLFLVIDVGPALLGGTVWCPGIVSWLAWLYGVVALAFFGFAQRGKGLSRTQALANAIRRSSVHFQQVLEGIPSGFSRFQLPGIAHPTRKLSFWGSFAQFLWACTPLYPAFLGKVLWSGLAQNFPQFWLHLSGMLLWLIVVFSWMTTAIRSGVPLQTFEKPSGKHSRLCHHVFFEDLREEVLGPPRTAPKL